MNNTDGIYKSKHAEAGYEQRKPIRKADGEFFCHFWRQAKQDFMRTLIACCMKETCGDWRKRQLRCMSTSG
jgi:hypothetical protein